jgi:hypothetical protein
MESPASLGSLDNFACNATLSFKSRSLCDFGIPGSLRLTSSSNSLQFASPGAIYRPSAGFGRSIHLFRIMTPDSVGISEPMGGPITFHLKPFSKAAAKVLAKLHPLLPKQFTPTTVAGRSSNNELKTSGTNLRRFTSALRSNSSCTVSRCNLASKSPSLAADATAFLAAVSASLALPSNNKTRFVFASLSCVSIRPALKSIFNSPAMPITTKATLSSSRIRTILEGFSGKSIDTLVLALYQASRLSIYSTITKISSPAHPTITIHVQKWSHPWSEVLCFSRLAISDLSADSFIEITRVMTRPLRSTIPKIGCLSLVFAFDALVPQRRDYATRKRHDNPAATSSNTATVPSAA